MEQDRAFASVQARVLTVEMDLEARAGRVLAGADGAEERLRIPEESGAFAADDVARHRSGAVARPAEMPTKTALLRREEIVARAQMGAVAAGQKP